MLLRWMGRARQYPWRWVATPGAVAALAVTFRRLHPRRIVVEGASMGPALEPGDRLVVLRRRRHRPGHVVAVRDPRRPSRMMVKRVAAVEEGGRLDVRGDDPAGSTDSRTFGAVPAHLVLGRAVWRYAPSERAGPVPGAGGGRR